MAISKEDGTTSWEQYHIILLLPIVLHWIWSLLDSDESLVVTRLSPPIFGLQHCCRFRKRMQLNMGGLRLNTLFLYFLFHHLYLFFLFFFFNFPSFCSLYFFFFYSFFFYFLLQPMLILIGLSWWWRIILFPFRVMNMVKLFKKAFWKFPLDIKIACYLDVKVHFSSSWKEEESWIQA